MKKLVVLTLLLSSGFIVAAHAQAPAGAPAGTNGICKDGTYSTAAKKEGACRGHKGVQTWYLAAAPAASGMPATAAPAKASAPAAMPAPAPAAAVASRPAPAPAPARTAPAMPAPAPTASATPAKRLSPEAAAAAKPQAPGGGPGLVWVNTESKVYHCNGDTYYGKTKAGSYMTEAAAQAAGAHGERGKTCAAK